MSWAIAGRQRSALEATRSKFAPIWPSIEQSVPILIGNAHDHASLVAIAESTKVVISLTGPYNLVGGMVDACVHAGTHYVDLTGAGG